jgi:YVTN family beta-propeller protein
MQSNNSDGSCAARARVVMAVFAVMLAMGLGFMDWPAAAAPFAYVANTNSGTVSVIDTGANPPSVVATIAVGTTPAAVAATRTGNTPMSRMRAPHLTSSALSR